MRKRIVRIWDVPAGGLLPALITVASAFCIGGLAGMLLAAQVGGGGHDSLAAYIEGYLAAAKSGSVVLSPGLLSVLWESVRWPLFAFLMGFTALGVLGIPTLFAVRGFLLSFAVSSFVRMFGGTGGILAFFAFWDHGACGCTGALRPGCPELCRCAGTCGQGPVREEGRVSLWEGLLGPLRSVCRRSCAQRGAGILGGPGTVVLGGRTLLILER